MKSMISRLFRSATEQFVFGPFPDGATPSSVRIWGNFVNYAPIMIANFGSGGSSTPQFNGDIVEGSYNDGTNVTPGSPFYVYDAAGTMPFPVCIPRGHRYLYVSIHHPAWLAGSPHLTVAVDMVQVPSDPSPSAPVKPVVKVVIRKRPKTSKPKKVGPKKGNPKGKPVQVVP